MSTTEATPSARPKIDFCSTFSERTGEETAGSAWAVRRHLLFEVPLPWPENYLESRHLPSAFLAYMERLWAKGDWDAIPGMIGIAPDEHYSIPGKKLVMHFQQPLPQLAGSYRGEAFAAEPERFVELLQMVIDDPDSPRLDEFRVPFDPASRDLLVCTHGSVDICCATFGAPIYKLMRAMADQAQTPVRVWRATHFGGHRFAPTALDLPTGHYWGRLKPDILSGLIHRNKPAANYRPLYRGSTSLQDPLWQRAEAELFGEAGWAWFDTTISNVSADTTSQDVERVAFTFSHPTAGDGEVAITLTAAGIIRTRGSTDSPDIHDAPQYRATKTREEPPGILARIAELSFQGAR